MFQIIDEINFIELKIGPYELRQFYLRQSMGISEYLSMLIIRGGGGWKPKPLTDMNFQSFSIMLNSSGWDGQDVPIH